MYYSTLFFLFSRTFCCIIFDRLIFHYSLQLMSVGLAWKSDAISNEKLVNQKYTTLFLSWMPFIIIKIWIRIPFVFHPIVQYCYFWVTKECFIMRYLEYFLFEIKFTNFLSLKYYYTAPLFSQDIWRILKWHVLLKSKK